MVRSQLHMWKEQRHCHGLMDRGLLHGCRLGERGSSLVTTWKAAVKQGLRHSSGGVGIVVEGKPPPFPVALSSSY